MRLSPLAFAIGCALLSPLVLQVPHAAAQTGMMDMSGMGDEEAKSHFKVGKTLYEAGRFSEAASEFEKAYALSKKEQLLYNIYVAYRDASDLPHAIDALRSYLDAAQLEPDERVNLQARLRAMEEANARAAATKPEPETAPAVATPVPAPAEPPAAAVAAPAPAATQAAPSAHSPLPYVLAIGGGTLLAGGIVTGLIASSKIGKIEDDCPHDMCPPKYGIADKRDSASAFRTTSFVLAGAGVVTGVIGAVLLLNEGGESAAASAALDCGPMGCSVHGTF
jgi:tetratricopeptide (TPR) repeat protein